MIVRSENFSYLLNINSDRLLGSIDELGEIGSTEEGGVTRLALSKEEVEAKLFVLDLMKRSGLETHLDLVGNVIGILRRGQKVVASGSHVDTVINGGKLDGAYGVLAAIEALRTIRESDIPLSHSLVALAFTNEEGVRFPAFTGSKYFAGLLSIDDAYSLSDGKGKTFKDALLESKLSLENIQFAGSSVDSFVELHIEQGLVLERKSANIGIVENIVGEVQYDIVFEGSADHAGTTPMNMRSDALLAASRFAIDVNELATEIDSEAVATVGCFQVITGAPNVIPGRVMITVDFRHKSDQIIELAKKMISELVQQNVEHKTRIRASLHQRTDVPPIKMNSRIMETIESCVGDLGFRSCRLQSGAGHDAMLMGKIADSGMIFVPSKDGKSHSPLEKTSPSDLVDGATALSNTLATLAR